MTSIPDLHKQTIKKLNKDVTSGKIVKLPPIPCVESVRLQLLPISTVVKAVGAMTDCFNVICKIQIRTLRNAHPD